MEEIRLGITIVQTQEEQEVYITTLPETAHEITTVAIHLQEVVTVLLQEQEATHLHVVPVLALQEVQEGLAEEDLQAEEAVEAEAAADAEVNYIL